MKKEIISCLECKYGKQIGEKVFYCCKHERNVMLQICTRIKKTNDIPNICKNCTGNSNLRTNNSFIDGVIYAADKFVQKLHEYNSEKYFDCLTNEDILKLRNDIIEEVK